MAELKGRTKLARLLRQRGGKGLTECLADIQKAGPVTAVRSGQIGAVKALIDRRVPFDVVTPREPLR